MQLSTQQQHNALFFSSAYEVYTEIDHNLDHKTNLNKFKMEIIQIIFSEQNRVKLETKTKRYR